MRILGIVLASLLVLIQYPLWIGKGGWLRVWELDHLVSQRKAQNDDLQARNDALWADVSDLKEGKDAVEERARFDLGMIRTDEVFMQIPESGAKR